MPNPNPGEIWFLEEPRLGNAPHGHYILITQVHDRSGNVTINFIATESSFYDDLHLSAATEGFKDSGLRHDSHLLRNQAYDITIQQLFSKGKFKGFVSGKLKLEVEEWWGASI